MLEHANLTKTVLLRILRYCGIQQKEFRGSVLPRQRLEVQLQSELDLTRIADG